MSQRGSAEQDGPADLEGSSGPVESGPEQSTGQQSPTVASQTERDGTGALAPFHPLVQKWFREQVGSPTPIQQKAWPAITAGRHVLLTAPTGSGKTLTAFLWALERLLTGSWTNGQTRVLYVSPLKALNSDIRRNLELPLEGLRRTFQAAGETVPEIAALTRSGDTPAAERRLMLRRPPEILITTPESLNILLTSKGGRSLLTGLHTVILDEVHAVVGAKRGTHLITAVERLVPLSGEVQRLAISATVRPLQRVAEWVGGWELLADSQPSEEPAYRQRPVEVVEARGSKAYDLAVRFPVSGQEELEEDALWEVLAQDFRRRVHRNRSTLLFANSRRLTEKVTRFINSPDAAARLGANAQETAEGRDRGELAYAHHGSLSREVRAVVEERLKAGELAAIVATNSLELGIDIGSLDEVLMIQTPPTVASALQRLGRAGHGVGEVSRGRIYPTFGRDFLDAAVVAEAAVAGEIEPVEPVRAPLDVLAQVVLSMLAAEPWTVHALHAHLRCTWPYRQLSRRQLDLVLDMLSGRYADSRVRELRPRIRHDRVSGKLSARKGVERLIYLSGGTIPERGYFALRLQDSMARLGELDEEFVWERSVGDTFFLGTQSWRIRRITHNDVLVTPAPRGAALAPFWRADARDRSFFVAERVGRLLAELEPRLGRSGLAEELSQELPLEAEAARELVDFLRRQKAATGRLPHRRRLLLERVRSRRGSGGRQQAVLHTLWGGAVNRPFSLALIAAWEARYGDGLAVSSSEDNLLLELPPGVTLQDLVSLVRPGQVENLLRHQLERTGFFGARFRIAAGIALLLPRAGFRNRLPLWLLRERAKGLLESVRDYGDFPVLAEAWRTCLQDEMDLASLERLLEELERGELELHEVVTESPSPLASELYWEQVNRLMYEDDTPRQGKAGQPGLSQDLLQELVFSSRLRPRLPSELCERFRRKVQRLLPGYAPTDGEELLDWLQERQLLTQAEWQELLAAARAAGLEEEPLAELWQGRAAVVLLPGAEDKVLVSIDTLPSLLCFWPPAGKGTDSQGAASLELLDPADWQSPAPAAAQQRLQQLIAGRQEKADARPPGDASGELGGGDFLAEDAVREEQARRIGEWLRWHGPVGEERLQRVWGLRAPALGLVLQRLQDSQQVVVDQLRDGGHDVEICDAQNLEILLRWLRAERRPDRQPGFQALPASQLPLFLAQHQGLGEPGGSIEDLQVRLDQLLAYPAPARLWETVLFPARLEPYYPAWLDSLMQENGLAWFGCGKERLLFAFPEDLELWQEAESGTATRTVGAAAVQEQGDEAEDAATIAQLFPTAAGRYSSEELAEHHGQTVAAMEEQLWQLAWRGQVRSDTFVPVRRAAAQRFQTESHKASPAPRRGGAPRLARRRRAFDRWQSKPSSAGAWMRIEGIATPADALEQEELVKDRLRLLLARYGLLFRELVERELPPLRWSRIFRTLRLMELSGEIVAGHFFTGIAGLQFCSHGAFRQLRDGLSQDLVYWHSAADPASLCGVEVEGLKGSLPPRQPSTHLVYQGSQLVLVARRQGKELEIRVPPDHPSMDSYLVGLKTLLTRAVEPLSSITVESINGESAPRSPYAEALGAAFRLVREPGCLKLWKQY